MYGIGRRYSGLYKAFSDIPELARFRRHLDLWSWILYNQSWGIDQQKKEIDRLIAEVYGVPSETCVFTVTDYHRAYVHDEEPRLKAAIEVLENLVRKQSTDLLMAGAVAKLPSPSEVHTDHFLKHYNMCFDKGVFEPTKEDADIYRQTPVHADLASFRDIDPQDPLTAAVIRYIGPTITFIRNLVHKVLMIDDDDEESLSQEGITLETILLMMNLLTAVYVPLLFVGGMGILSIIKSEKTGIIVLGLLCLWLTLSLTFCSPSLRRSDIYAVAAAFCAVGGIYLGTKNINNY